MKNDGNHEKKSCANQNLYDKYIFTSPHEAGIFYLKECARLVAYSNAQISEYGLNSIELRAKELEDWYRRQVPDENDRYSWRRFVAAHPGIDRLLDEYGADANSIMDMYL